jgi:hypothetical protein
MTFQVLSWHQLIRPAIRPTDLRLSIQYLKLHAEYGLLGCLEVIVNQRLTENLLYFGLV